MLEKAHNESLPLKEKILIIQSQLNTKYRDI